MNPAPASPRPPDDTCDNCGKRLAPGGDTCYCDDCLDLINFHAANQEAVER